MADPFLVPLPADVHVRRSGDDYAQALLNLLPQGQAWPRHAASVLVQACNGLSDYWGFVDGRAADLLETESDPRITLELLSDWERAWGLPDPCFPDTTTIAQRRAMLILKMTMLGGQSRAWFEWVANWLGYSITISEYAPFMAGISQVGDTRSLDDSGQPFGNYRWYIGPPEMRFYWTIHMGQVALVWFRASQGQAGVDHHLHIGIPEDLECLFNRWQPAQTQVIFDFSGSTSGNDPMAGTP
ncbi:MAG TPA: putative phage tail protein [Xanthobacteraceae bacterium]